MFMKILRHFISFFKLLKFVIVYFVSSEFRLATLVKRGETGDYEVVGRQTSMLRVTYDERQTLSLIKWENKQTAKICVNSWASTNNFALLTTSPRPNDFCKVSENPRWPSACAVAFLDWLTHPPIYIFKRRKCYVNFTHTNDTGKSARSETASSYYGHKMSIKREVPPLSRSFNQLPLRKSNFALQVGIFSFCTDGFITCTISRTCFIVEKKQIKRKRKMFDTHRANFFRLPCFFSSARSLLCNLWVNLQPVAY